MNYRPPNAAGSPLVFPDWQAQLAGDQSLLPGVRESYRLTVSRFLAFCRQRGGGGVTVRLAREFVELARLEQAPSGARLAGASKFGWLR